MTALRFAAGVVAVVAAAAAPEAAETVPANPGFEAVSGGMAVGWRVESGGGPASVAVDRLVAHEGVSSLRVEAPAPASVTVVSEPLALDVGRIYRLRGFVRTASAFSDGLARYPTAVPACLTMASFPFTNHSPAVGATRDWTPVETVFVATAREDRVRLHLGFNGSATGTAWFDDVAVERVDDVSALVPPETVRWFGPAYRFDDRGWIFVHIEGEPYQRGYQYGVLVGEEIAAYARKLAVRQDVHDPAAGWEDLRFETQAITLRRFEDEYQLEMKGIADGAAHAGAKLFGRSPDLVDVAVLNSVIDLGQMKSALDRTADATSGIDFRPAEDEMLLADENHHCSAFAATGSATADGRFVFGQIFMWNGYTGVHWDVICDVQPVRGHRFVHHTFPGGIHSGADFYINDAGLVIGETTVSQTPYDEDGTPQSNRIRKAIQYADTIDEVVDIMTTRNNGQYTNEWPFADAKTDEVGIFLLGTEKHRLWRSSAGEFPGGTTDFYWCNNNNKDLEVRREYVVSPLGAPFDLMFRPWNRDLAFNDFYRRTRGRIDAIAGVRLWASSPINRAHACDGKITTADMAERLVFLAHYGKVTLREKLVGGRFIPDLPEAVPHLSLGYSTASPVVVTEALQATRPPHPAAESRDDEPDLDVSAAADAYSVDGRALWRGTIAPATQAESWLVSGSAAYWRMLHDLPAEPAAAAAAMDAALAELRARYLWVVEREGDLVPTAAEERFDQYRHYDIPRIKGVVALHQLRLLLGTDRFLEAMRSVYEAGAGGAVTSGAFIAALEEASGEPLAGFVRQWTDRSGLPSPDVEASVRRTGLRWEVTLRVLQRGEPYRLLGFVDISAGSAVYRRPMEISGPRTVLTFEVPERPTGLVFDAGGDFPVASDRSATMGDFLEDFHRTLIVYGTAREIEANRTLAQHWQETVADAYVEILPPLRKDCEVTAEELAASDLMVLGQAGDNTLLAAAAAAVPELEVGRNMFRWRGRLRARPDDGLVVAAPSPWAAGRNVYLIVANSALQLHRMTQRWERLPSWGLYRGSEIVDRGYHPVQRYVFAL